MKERFATDIMNEGERLRELLDGSMDPSELESYQEYYKLAERVYGREALDEMGISTPDEIEEGKIQNGSSEFSHDVILPKSGNESITDDSEDLVRKPKRRLFLTFIGLIGLMLVSSNIVIGIDAISPISLCEDMEAIGEIEFTNIEQVDGNSLTIFWTVKNVTIGGNYTITWDISQNGSQELVDSGSFSWQANGNTFTHLKTVTVQTEPYAWSSNLLDENMSIILTTEGDYTSSDVNTMSIIESGKLCEDNPKLILSEVMNYQELDAWSPSGEGDMLDGMLVVIFSLISLFGIRKR